jgi:hypothetical protein
MNYKIHLVIPVLIVLGGCAQTYTWVKPGAANSEFYRAKSYCQALASGATPMDYSNQGSSTTYHSGTVSGSGGSYGTYSGTSTTYNNNTGQAFANLGQSIRRQNLFNDCMRGEGWVPEEEYRQNWAAQSNGIGNTPGTRTYVNDLKDWTESAPPYETAEVKIENMKVLSKPTFAGEMLGKLNKGDDVSVIKTAADTWLLIRRGDLEGYVAKKWVTPQ